jgi:S1-C subfamily serine protease
MSAVMLSLHAPCRILIVCGFFPFALPAAQAETAQSRRLSANRSQPTVADEQVTALEQAARQTRSPQDAVVLYQAFIARYELSASQRERVGARLAIWHRRAERLEVLVGADWMEPLAAKAVADAADELVDEGLDELQRGNPHRARDLFERASRKNPSGIRADYLLGMLNTPNLWNYAPWAERHFDRAHRRLPDNVAAANNLALARINVKKFSEALDVWSDVLAGEWKAPDVVHNLGRFIQEAHAGRIPATKLQVERAARLYQKALVEQKGTELPKHTGWKYAPLAFTIDGSAPVPLLQRSTAPKPRILLRDSADGGVSKSNATLGRVLVANGTGFVVHPHYLLTDRRLIEAGEFIVVYDSEGFEHEGKLSAVSDNLGLALVFCPTLNAPPLPVAAEAPQRGADVLVLGFPLPGILGDTLKSVRGTIFGFDDDDAANATVMYEATTNPGNRGSPVCDETGRVVAVHANGVNLSAFEKSGGRLGLGVPLQKAVPFLTAEFPDFTAAAPGPEIAWPEVDRQAADSVVLIRLYDSPRKFRQLPEWLQQDNGGVFEDRNCTACQGRACVTCPVRGCYRGAVRQFAPTYTIEGIGAGSRVLQWMRPVAASCPGCGGTGLVRCRHCLNGDDPRLHNSQHENPGDDN